MQAGARTINPPFCPFMLCREGRKKAHESVTAGLLPSALSHNYQTRLYPFHIKINPAFGMEFMKQETIHGINGHGGHHHECFRTSQQAD